LNSNQFTNQMMRLGKEEIDPNT